MTVFAVTFDGVTGPRFNEVQDFTNWSNYGGSGAGGAVEPSLAYQNGQCAARKQAVTGGTLGGIQLANAATVDMTATDQFLWFFKYYLADAFDANVTEGARIGIGDGSSASSRSYNISGSTAKNDAYLAYPARGGYILGSIDPSNSFWPIASAGTIDLTLIDWFGCQGSWINGNAKSLNIAMDSIDIGVGLYLVGGTGADPLASFTSYVAFDQDIVANRWGCCAGAGTNVEAWAILRAGGAIEFFDNTSIVAFKDGYHGAGFTGVLHELDTAASTFDVGATLIGEGKLYDSGAIDTRPDYIVTGTTMTAPYNLSANLRNFRNVTFTSKVAADGADIECQLLTQASADIENCIIRTNALTNVACLQDPTFGSTTDLNNTQFIQSGVGHAIEALATGTWTDIGFVGYGGTPGSNLVAASGAADAAIFNDTGGAITITIAGDGDVPSVRNGAGATTTIISGTVTTTITVTDAESPPVAISGARVFLETSDGTGPLPFEEAVTITQTGGLATVSHTAHGIPDGTNMVIRGAAENEYNKVAVITVTGVNEYTYAVDSGASSPATGSPISSGVIIHGTTNGSGVISDTRELTSDQPFKGSVRDSSGSPFHVPGSVVGIVSNTAGFSATVSLQSDE